ncbi:hypothetical protein UlMin_008569 [Ulmus minor]
MSPSQYHAKRNVTNTTTTPFCPPPLKINQESHTIKKSSSSPPSSSTASSPAATKPLPQQQRSPVIIYTHSPKVIHTHPRDFMALVQKLTGQSHPEDTPPPPTTKKPEAGANLSSEANKNTKINNTNDDNESTSVITDENCSSEQSQVINSGFVAQPNPYLMNNYPIFGSNSGDFFCPNQPFYNYPDPLIFSGGPPNIRTHVPSLDGINEFREY